MISLDVDCLYTYIETPLCFQAVWDCFNKYLDASRPGEAIIKLLELILTCNDFEFVSDVYLQSKGQQWERNLKEISYSPTLVRLNNWIRKNFL